MQAQIRSSWRTRLGLATALSLNGCFVTFGSSVDVHIEQPTNSSSFTTSQAEITLGGSVFHFNTVSSRPEIDWANATTGDAGFGTLKGSHWICGPIPLEVGPNLLKVHGSAFGAGSDSDSITVTYAP